MPAPLYFSQTIPEQVSGQVLGGKRGGLNQSRSQSTWHESGPPAPSLKYLSNERTCAFGCWEWREASMLTFLLPLLLLSGVCVSRQFFNFFKKKFQQKLNSSNQPPEMFKVTANFPEKKWAKDGDFFELFFISSIQTNLFNDLRDFGILKICRNVRKLVSFRQIICN